MVSLGIISTLFTTWFGIPAAAAAAAGTARQQHVQPQASDEKEILYIVGGMIGNTTLVASPSLSALQMNAVAAAAAEAPFFLSSDRIMVMGSHSAGRRQQQPVNDLSNADKDDDDNTQSVYQYPIGPSHHQNNHSTGLLLYMVKGTDLWQLGSLANKWTLLAEQVRGFAGPSTVMARSGDWLISCLAQDECVCFDTHARMSMPCHTTTIGKAQKMLLRGPTRMVLLADRYALVHGVKNPMESFVGDRWLLDLANAPHLVWRQEPFASSLSRGPMVDAANRVFRPTDDTRLHALVRRASDNGTTSARATATTTTAKPKETETGQTSQPLSTTAASAGGLNGGAIAGIVVGVGVFFFVVGCLLLWNRRRRRSKLYYFQKQHHRSARFSLTTTPPASRPASTVHEHLPGGPGLLPIARTASLPEPVRNSGFSFGSDPRLSTSIPSSPSPHINRLSHLHQDFSASYSSVCMPGSRYDSRIPRHSLKEATRKRDETIQPPEPVWLRPSPPLLPPPPPSSSETGQGGAPTSALRRLTFNISSALRRPQSSNLSQNSTMAQSTPSSLLKRYTISGMVSDRRRTSGMLFGGSADPGPSRQLSNCDGYKPPRMSMSSARSVSSVQWVGFNDQMDYKEQHWDPNVQLAVTNELNRHSVSSSRTTSIVGALESGSSPRQSTPSYRLSTQEVHSWEDMLYLQQSGMNLARSHHQHPSATSLPVLPHARYHTPASLESVLMDHSKISV